MKLLNKRKKFRQKEKVKSPTLELVKEYFKFQNFTEFEAERFFNYYSSIGWLIGGKTKMKDWQAAARNWMLNTPKFSVNLPNPQAQKQIRNLEPTTSTQPLIKIMQNHCNQICHCEELRGTKQSNLRFDK